MKRKLKKKILITSESNFTYGELIKSDTALRHDIDNMPDEQSYNNLVSLVNNVLQPVRNVFGPLRITSGYRSKELCAVMNSSPTSNHTLGQAADIEPVDPNIKLIDILEWIYYNCDYRELIAEFFPNGWIHIAYRKKYNNKKLLLKDPLHNYEKVDLQYIKNIYF